MPKKKKKLEEQPMEMNSPEPVKREKQSQEKVQHARKGQLRYRNFDEFWFKISKERRLENRWKEPLKKHLKAAGYWSPEKYEEGLKHFGL